MSPFAVRAFDHFCPGCQETVVYDHSGFTIFCQKEKYHGDLRWRGGTILGAKTQRG